MSFPAPTSTIHQILARGLCIDAAPEMRAHHPRAQFWIPAASASPWEGFTLKAILAAYGDILEGTTMATPNDMTIRVFNVERLANIKDMLAVYIHRLMPQPLEIGRKCLAPRLGLRLDARPIEVTQNPQVGPGRPPMMLRYDGQPLVIAAVRTRSDWSSQNPHGTGLFDQLLGYANEGSTRYGFAATDAEFVVTQTYTVNDEMAIRYHAIPIDASGIDQVTPALALWCLAMMALNPHHRTPGPEEETYSFNTWYVDVRENGEVTYMHHLSRVVRSTIPPIEGRRLLPRPQSE
ncbi:hypothetical protein B0T11DRAFT_316747 [Plectosphaerella cucumerina]|uniref:Uncharacterized protein n=1 Tax=Plectosphaerella cucumerina TaxID=40658 RepID=A0A8K0X681_9PEZI|nr:hypothetical protein B0T11DRAFT_316747 [Plectosphaerella cucumerina]